MLREWEPANKSKSERGKEEKGSGVTEDAESHLTGYLLDNPSKCF